MKYPAHLAVAWAITTAATIAHVSWIIDFWTVISYFSLFLNKIGISSVTDIDMNSSAWLALTISYVISNIVNDLDNPKSLIGKAFIFISVPAWLISVLIYSIFYSKSFKGINRAFGWGIFSIFNTANVAHRILFHNEIGYFLILFGFSYLMSKMSVEPAIFVSILMGFTGWYMTHIACDAISWKVPLPLTLRILIILTGWRKETFGLALGK